MVVLWSYWNLKGRPEIIKDGAWGRGPISHFFIIMDYSTGLQLVHLVAGSGLGAGRRFLYQPVLLRRTRIAGIPENVVEGAPLDHGSCMACLPCAGTFCFLRAMHFALEISAPRYTSFTIVNGTVSEPASQDLTFGISLHWRREIT
jgi:hypothetical protein